MAGVGFDAAVMRDALVKLKGSVGWAAYLVSAVGAHVDHGYTTFQGRRVRVRLQSANPVRSTAT
jgi:hypothetical protein